MVKVYIRLIKRGIFTIEDVRLRLSSKPDVLAQIEELYNEDQTL